MRKIVAKYDGKCIVCGNDISEGETVYWESGRGIWHLGCEPKRVTYGKKSDNYLKITIGIIIILVIVLGYQLAAPLTSSPRVITVTVTTSQAYTVTERITEEKSVIKETSTQVQETIEESKWFSSDGEVISYMEADKYVGKTKTVEGTIVRTYKSSSSIFLNFHDPYQGYFYVVIFKDDWGNFPFNPDDYYRGLEVRVTGQIKEYQGSPEIIVEYPSQIEVANKGFDYP